MTPPPGTPIRPGPTADVPARPRGPFDGPRAGRAFLADPGGPRPDPSTPTIPD